METVGTTMSPKDAAAELEKWRGGTTLQDRLIARAYRAMKRGRRVIDLFESMRLAGVDELGRPKLAIARADAKRCHFYHYSLPEWVRFDSDNGWSQTKIRRIPGAFLPGVKKPPQDQIARVPLVPPKYRPADLKRYYILFEAAWNSVTEDISDELEEWRTYIDWIIIGGESGAGCRPMPLQWAANLRVKCRDYGIAYFLKQLGGNPDKRHNLEQFPEELRVREFPNASR